MTTKTKRYMIEAIDKVTQKYEGQFMARDIQEQVSLLSLKKVSTVIIGKVLCTMMDSGYIKKVGESNDCINIYVRGSRHKYPGKRKGAKW